MISPGVGVVLAHLSWFILCLRPILPSSLIQSYEFPLLYPCTDKQSSCKMNIYFNKTITLIMNKTGGVSSLVVARALESQGELGRIRGQTAKTARKQKNSCISNCVFPFNKEETISLFCSPRGKKTAFVDHSCQLNTFPRLEAQVCFT